MEIDPSKSLANRLRKHLHPRAILRLFSFLGVSLAVLCSTGCAGAVKIVIAVDRHNPESVLRAYFDAWARSDWVFQASLMDEKYGMMQNEPVDSIRIVELQSIPDVLKEERAYCVVFNIQVKGDGVSMQSGQTTWIYYLTWEPKRNSWIITNYGAG